MATPRRLETFVLLLSFAFLSFAAHVSARGHVYAFSARRGLGTAPFDPDSGADFDADYTGAIASVDIGGAGVGASVTTAAASADAVADVGITASTGFGAGVDAEANIGAGASAGVGVAVGAGAGAGAKVFDVSSFEAKPDGETNNAMAFIRAWNAACKSNGPAKLVFPKQTYLSGPVVFQGPCTNGSPMIVEFQGTIKALEDLSEYTDQGWILFERIDGLVIKGGLFDGQGPNAWKYSDCTTNKDCKPLPYSLFFKQVKNAEIDGLSSLNSKGFHMSITFCESITVRNIKITAPDESPNTDGVHISSSNGITVKDSVIGTGDDCVGIIQGATNINVTNVRCGPGHGISIGSLGKRPIEKDVKGVFVSNCTLINTTNGVRIKTWAGQTALQATDITFQDIVLESVKNPIIIDQHYGSKQRNTPSSVKISNIHFKNIKGSTVSVNAVSLACSPSNPCQNVELTDINLSYVGSKRSDMTSACENAKTVVKGIQTPQICASTFERLQEK